MSYTWYGDKPPSYPLFKPVQSRHDNGKPRWREWGKRDPKPITLTLSTATRPTALTPNEPASLETDAIDRRGVMYSPGRKQK